ncbi:MAG TPA: glycerol-3-phosphate 1-O-acyltransferase PlsY [Bacteroidales bacterium]|jgi:glycerol-3-phosphate acyltransferase PlsY|nr:glycerol-3-phosphate 1-O-acyltransferase PlsY [Bacteroidales bacterium]HRW21089.1 glycerol-3-phosphate 1-O-acyltransferase PlsY [Bacteroidales bacterium]
MTIDILIHIALLIAAYLIGSFSSAFWLVKWFYKSDIRQLGSKNAGATNVFRVFGYKPAIPVFIVDVAKAFAAMQLVYFSNIENELINTVFFLALGIAAFVGHVFPVFSSFKGGKGVACFLGIVLAVDPLIAFFAVLVFVIVLLVSQTVSLSSLIASFAYAIIMFIKINDSNLPILIFSVIVPIVMVLTHIANIKRIFKGEEKRIFSYRK